MLCREVFCVFQRSTFRDWAATFFKLNVTDKHKVTHNDGLCQTLLTHVLTKPLSLSLSAAVLPHGVHQCDGAEPLPVRVSVAHDGHQPRFAARPSE